MSKTEVITNGKTGSTESGGLKFLAINHDEVSGNGLWRRRGSISSPRKKIVVDLDPCSESDSELDRIVRRSPSFAQKTFNQFNIRAHKAFEQVEDFVQHVWDVVSHHSLPEWLKDNDYLISGHRPQLNSYWACFKSIFRLHSETGNIWTHLLGCLAFVILTTSVLLNFELNDDDKLVHTIYCIGAIMCLGFSSLFHTLYCHSEPVGKLFGKLDYCGISIMVMASFVPWLYYGFYCQDTPRLIYLTTCMLFGILCIVVSLRDQFSEPGYRPVRAGLFVAFGLSGVIPVGHFVLSQGVYRAFQVSPLGWGIVMGVLYLSGATVYAYRIPECFWPGKFDYWGQSHQIFHIFVVAAAFVNFHAMNLIHQNLASISECALPAAM